MQHTYEKVKTKVIPVIAGENETISNIEKNFLGSITSKHDIKGESDNK
jgi:hypothetical protein